LERLMRLNNQRLYRTARSILRDDAEAEDAVQESYLLAHRAMGKFRGSAKLSTWLMRIVANEAIARLRKRSRHAELIQLNGMTDPFSEDGEVNVGNSPEQPEDAVEEMTAEEAGACLGIPTATVRTRYFRAKGLLREALAREIDFSIEDAFSFDGERCDRIVAGVLQQLIELPPAST
jgi:RNA polymerase sigma-70 factor (ECF subfamily)